MINLKNKKAVITGATGGIGYSILEKFHSEGVNVLGSGTNDEKLSKLKNDFSGAIFKKFDISKHDEIEKFVDEVCSELDGCPEILINNAGITKDNLAIIHLCNIQEGIIVNIKTPKSIVNMAEGQLIIYHNLLVIIFSCLVRISFSGLPFLEASI